MTTKQALSAAINAAYRSHNLDAYDALMTMREPVTRDDEELNRLRESETRYATQLQELAEILTGQPGTACHFRGLKDIAISLVHAEASKE